MTKDIQFYSIFVCIVPLKDKVTFIPYEQDRGNGGNEILHEII